MEKDVTLGLGGIPDDATLPVAPRSVDASAMTDDELALLLRGRIAEAESDPGVSIQQVREELL